MRDILFRAKRVDNREWVEGCLVYDNQHTCVRDFGYEYREVIPETVGQYTGLKDKNGKKIFEGDILSDNSGQPLYVCVFADGRFGFYTVKEYLDRDFTFYDEDFATSVCKIIGNIHNNPELLDKE